MIYLDNAATTKPCDEARAAVTDAMENLYGNASSLYDIGINSQQMMLKAKRTVLDALRVGEGEVYFTSGATESNNTAIFGACSANPRRGKRIVSTLMEHPSVSKALDELEKSGFEVVRLSPVEHGDIEQAAADAVDDKTVLVSVMAVNNETGLSVDVKRLYGLVKRRNPGTLVHIDAVQGFLKVPLEGDLISVSGHKLHATKGIGALYIKNRVKCSPLIYGGGQQHEFRSGTEPIELICGFDAAIRAYKGERERFELLKRRLTDGLRGLSDIKMNSDGRCVPNIINFSVRGVKSETMLHFLEEKGIYVSSGSACSRGKVSPVLKALGVSDEDADSAIRVSLCADNTEEEIDILLENIKKGIERFRR